MRARLEGEAEPTMYDTHWGLERPAFEDSPDPRMVFLARPHEDALLLLHHFAARREGVALLTGEAGSGRTSLLRRLATLLPDDVLMGMVSGGPRLAERLLVQIRADAAECSLDGRLGEIHDAGRKALVVVDDAHRGGFAATLDEVTTLAVAHPGLAVVLAGSAGMAAEAESTFGGTLAFPVRAHLSPLDPDDSARLVAHRLRAAGFAGADLPFTDDALAELDALALGNPRALVQHADAALLYASAESLPRVDGATLRLIARATGRRAA